MHVKLYYGCRSAPTPMSMEGTPRRLLTSLGISRTFLISVARALSRLCHTARTFTIV